MKQIGVIYETNYSRMDQVKFVEDSHYKKLKENGLLKQTVLLQTFYSLSSTNFTWSILEYFDGSEYLILCMDYFFKWSLANKSLMNIFQHLSISYTILFSGTDVLQYNDIVKTVNS